MFMHEKTCVIPILLTKVSDLLSHQDVTLTPQEMIAIHRIPGKPGSPKPVLMKVINTSTKTKIIKKKTSNEISWPPLSG